MKIYIGPYPKSYDLDWCFEPMRKVFPNNMVDFLESKSYNVMHWVLGERKQKVDIHIDPHDTWSMDHTLALIIIPMLKQLKEHQHGAPRVDDKDVPKHLRRSAAPKVENPWDVDDNHFKRWEWVMDEMIFAFENVVDDVWEYKLTGKELTEHDKRVKNGLRLFGVYYKGLWD